MRSRGRRLLHNGRARADGAAGRRGPAPARRWRRAPRGVHQLCNARSSLPPGAAGAGRARDGAGAAAERSREAVALLTR